MFIRYLACAALLLLAPVAAGAYGSLHLLPVVDGSYQDECNFVEPAGSGGREVAVVLVGAFDTFAGVDLFRVDTTGINWVPLSVTSSHTLIGGFSGMQVAFGSCLSPPIVVATLTYFSPGASPCGTLSITPMTGDGQLLVKCDLSYAPGQHAPLTINGVYDMPPGGFDPSCWCPTVGTETSTWGRVKALYRD